MKKVVVSLKDSGRRENFDKLFAGLGHEYFDAIVPQDNDPRFDQFIAKSLYGRELRKGEVGCTLSHFEIIKTFSESTDDSHWLLIMEDDALPEPQFQQFIVDFSKECSQLSDTPQVILLGHSKTSKKHLFVQRVAQPLKKFLFICGENFGRNKNITLCGTVCYLINKKAAGVIAKSNVTYWMADDWKLLCKLGVVVSHPFKPFVYENLTYVSSTDNVIFEQHDLFKRPLGILKETLINRIRFYCGSY